MKKTTEQFVSEARKIHGDKYDYSKTAYLTSNDKVCIICPIHGEFWQVASSHLSKCGCPKCAIKQSSIRYKIWTEEKCFDAAKEYSTRGDFKKGNQSAYDSARKNGWLDQYTWFEPARKQVTPGHWTYARCFEEARKYSTKADFTKFSYGAKQVAVRKGWIKDYTWFIPPFRWTEELCIEEARKYTSKLTFLKGNAGAYKYASRKKMFDKFSWFIEEKKPNGYWTEERCYEEAIKYESKKDFVRGCPAAHSAAVRHGWLETYEWFGNERFDILGRIDCVYAYVFEEFKTAYIGRTLMRRQKARDKEHIFNTESDAVAKFAENNGCEIPPMMILEANLTLSEGQKQEDSWKNHYINLGYELLNKAATGQGVGSLGAINHGKWNKETCLIEAQKYQYVGDFEKQSASACAAARRNGWIKEYTWLNKRWEPLWNKDTCFQEAKKYSSRREFQTSAPGAYNKAIRNGWIDEYTWMPSRQQKPSGFWQNYDNCFQEAKKYSSRREFQRACPSAYTQAWKNGWIDEYTWLQEKSKPSGYWTRETCFEEAKKYRSRSEFSKNAVAAYHLARKNGWLKEYNWFVNLVWEWTYDSCKLEASKYKKRSHFKAECPGAYQKSRKNGWLDEFFPK
ncbi:MAG: hypothetical protein KBT06_02155 [Prevotellaceae bacterium]|nr:hypothetical protein [Candidatus Colivivens equi]